VVLELALFRIRGMASAAAVLLLVVAAAMFALMLYVER
jgi:hypothetical protein